MVHINELSHDEMLNIILKQREGHRTRMKRFIENQKQTNLEEYKKKTTEKSLAYYYRNKETVLEKQKAFKKAKREKLKKELENAPTGMTV